MLQVRFIDGALGYPYKYFASVFVINRYIIKNQFKCDLQGSTRSLWLQEHISYHKILITIFTKWPRHDAFIKDLVNLRIPIQK